MWVPPVSLFFLLSSSSTFLLSYGLQRSQRGGDGGGAGPRPRCGRAGAPLGTLPHGGGPERTCTRRAGAPPYAPSIEPGPSWRPPSLPSPSLVTSPLLSRKYACVPGGTTLSAEKRRTWRLRISSEYSTRDTPDSKCLSSKHQ